MIDAATQTRLFDLLRREGQSFLQYLRDALPYTPPGHEEALDQLRFAAYQERRVLDDLGALLHRWRIRVPQWGTFPAAFTGANYVSVSSLLPRLLAAQRELLAQVQADSAALVLPSEARKMLAGLLDRKQHNLDLLLAMQAGTKRPGVAPASG